MLRAAVAPLRLAALCTPSRAARLCSPPPRVRALRIMAATHVSVPAETLHALSAHMRPTEDVFDMVKQKQVVLIGESRRVARGTHLACAAARAARRKHAPSRACILRCTFLDACPCAVAAQPRHRRVLSCVRRVLAARRGRTTRSARVERAGHICAHKMC
jgi:hypothetical protein